MNETLRRKLENLPKKPGVYLMRDSKGDVIYVGKAKILTNRVRQYFQSQEAMPVKTSRMVSKIEDIEYILTDSEAEALMLECNLIKQYHPFYNIMLRDDKSYPYLVLTTSENYPRLFLTRRRGRENNRSFGPYMNAGMARSVGETINHAYPLQKCTKKTKFGTKVGKPCLYYHMGECLGCCTGTVTSEAYSAVSSEVASILAGQKSLLVDKLTTRMQDAAEALRFEEAAAARNAIAEANSLFDEQQKVVTDSQDDYDIVAVAFDDDTACAQTFVFRQGKMIDTLTKTMRVYRDSREAIVGSFIGQHYADNPYVPSTIFVPCELEESALLEEALSLQKGRKVSLKVPKRGDKLRLMNLAGSNARMNIENKRTKAENKARGERQALAEIAQTIGASQPIVRIEAFDNSNIASALSVSAMVVFVDAKKATSEYRKFRIKETAGGGDTAAMAEAVFRRLNRAFIEERDSTPNPKFLPVPQLILVDGGQPQVNAVLPIVSMFPWPITVAGLVKDNSHKLRGLVDAQGKETTIKQLKSSYVLLNEISEEVHRSAVGYHRSLRSSAMTDSELTAIPGMGEKRALALLGAFKTMEAIREASVEELAGIQGMNKRVAFEVYRAFHLELDETDEDGDASAQGHKPEPKPKESLDELTDANGDIAFVDEEGMDSGLDDESGFGTGFLDEPEAKEAFESGEHGAGPEGSQGSEEGEKEKKERKEER